MFSLSVIFGGLIFGAIGLTLFRWGKQKNNLYWVVIGITMMTYTLFAHRPGMVWLIGGGLTALAYYFKDRST